MKSIPASDGEIASIVAWNGSWEIESFELIPQQHTPVRRDRSHETRRLRVGLTGDSKPGVWEVNVISSVEPLRAIGLPEPLGTV